MRVAVDAGPLLDPETGVGRYTRELIWALESLGVVVDRYAIALGGRAEPSIVRRRVPARLAQASWKMFGAPAVDSLVPAASLVHATNFVLPALKHLPGAVTVHDLSFERPDAFPGGKRLRSMVPWSVGRAARVLVPTAAVEEEVLERYGPAPEKVSVTPEGVAPEFFGATPLAEGALARLGITRPFALALGTIEPRKNLPRLLEAWSRADLGDWTLVLAGAPGWGPRLPQMPGVVRMGRVAAQTLPGLLAAAELFCYPSLYEGFGLPPLEAMAAGTPVLAGSTAASREVLGDAALLVEPTDVDALTGALLELAADGTRRRALALAGRARAVGFTWEQTAVLTLKVYEEMLRE